MRILITYYDITQIDSTYKKDAFDLVEILKGIIQTMLSHILLREIIITEKEI